MKKSSSVLIAIVVIAVVIGGGYAIFHKSPKAAAPSTAKSSAPAVNNAVLITKTDSNLGQYLADPSGKALYTYNADTPGVSNCTGSCLTNWPAYQDKGSTTNLPTDVSTIKRTDNSQTQYTYMGLPLYYFVSDGSGQVTGNGIDNFKVAKPVASSSPSASTPSPSSNSSSQPSYNY